MHILELYSNFTRRNYEEKNQGLIQGYKTSIQGDIHYEVYVFCINIK